MRVVACVVLSLALAGCSARRPFNVTPDVQDGPASRVAARAPQDSLETFMAKVRQLSVEARPSRPLTPTIEGSDPALAAALAAALAVPAPRTYRAVAKEYARLQIMDRAHEYLGRALALDPQDGATHDALARLWRDAGFPHLALGDAYRGVHHAPASPMVRNTLGTIFQALGRREAARAQYERALQLDPNAAYALNNLCYAWVLEGRAEHALSACRRALQLEPDLAAAQNNLGLAHAVAGDLAAARGAFAALQHRARALYNLGIVHLAQRRYSAALTAFEAAHAAQPTLTRALARARQARQAADGGEE